MNFKEMKKLVDEVKTQIAQKKTEIENTQNKMRDISCREEYTGSYKKNNRKSAKIGSKQN